MTFLDNAKLIQAGGQTYKAIQELDHFLDEKLPKIKQKDIERSQSWVKPYAKVNPAC